MLKFAATEPEPSHAPASQLPEIKSLDGLRFFAAAMVAVAHTAAIMLPAATPGHKLLSDAGHLGMTLFFVLSGFVIHYNYARSITEQPARGTIRFFVARFARLYPLFVLFLVLDTLLHLSAPVIDPRTNAIAGLPAQLTLTQT